MIEKINNYLNIVILIGMSIFIIYFLIGGIAMDKGVGRYRFSNSLEEAKKDRTFISEYKVYDNDNRYVMKTWLEYYKTIDIYKNIVIDKDATAIRIIKNELKISHNSRIYWTAFFRDQKLTVFEDKGGISVFGVDNNMDTIILKSNKQEVFYILKR